MPHDMSSIAPGREARPEHFALTTFLVGRTRAWGVFEDRFGRMRRRIEIEMNGVWRGPDFILDEHFVYDDGRTEQRQWVVRPKADGRFTATCADCIGEAMGTCTDGMIRMTYGFRLRLPSRVVTVDFDDRMYKMSDKTAVNRATVRKWGVKIGELALFLERADT
jgi:Protein of unknown function (DUF3833)